MSITISTQTTPPTTPCKRKSFSPDEKANMPYGGSEARDEEFHQDLWYGTDYDRSIFARAGGTTQISREESEVAPRVVACRVQCCRHCGCQMEQRRHRWNTWPESSYQKPALDLRKGTRPPSRRELTNLHKRNGRQFRGCTREDVG